MHVYVLCMCATLLLDSIRPAPLWMGKELGEAPPARPILTSPTSAHARPSHGLLAVHPILDEAACHEQCAVILCVPLSMRTVILAVGESNP